MSWLKGYLHSWITKKQTEKTIRNINEENLARRNITVYEPSEIEAFFHPREPVGNILISGGNPENRSRAITAACLCAFHNNIPVIILHETDNQLEQRMAYAFQSTNKMTFVNGGNPIYDPFWGLSGKEIAYMVMTAATKIYEIKPNGRQYIEGIAEFINLRRIPICSDMFIRCPHATLLDRVDDFYQEGNITESQARRVRNLLMQGQSERAGIEGFFTHLGHEGRYLISDRANRYRSVNLRQTVKRGGLLMLDIQSSTNTLLLNVIVNEIQDVLARGKDLLLVLDGVNIASNERLEGLVNSQSSRCKTAIASQDVYAALGSKASLFAAVVGTAQKCVVFTHQSGISCEKWASIFGYYDKGVIAHDMSSSRNLQESSYGTSQSISVSMSQEYRVKPQEISALSQEEVLLLNCLSGELAYTKVV